MNEYIDRKYKYIRSRKNPFQIAFQKQLRYALPDALRDLYKNPNCRLDFHMELYNKGLTAEDVINSEGIKWSINELSAIPDIDFFKIWNDRNFKKKLIKEPVYHIHTNLRTTVDQFKVYQRSRFVRRVNISAMCSNPYIFKSIEHAKNELDGEEYRIDDLYSGLSRNPNIKFRDCINNDNPWWSKRHFGTKDDVTLDVIMSNKSFGWNLECLLFNPNITLDDMKVILNEKNNGLRLYGSLTYNNDFKQIGVETFCKITLEEMYQTPGLGWNIKSMLNCPYLVKEIPYDFHCMENPFLTIEHIERWINHPSILRDCNKNRFMYDDVVYKTYALRDTEKILRKIFLNVLDNDTVNSILKYVTFDWIEL